MNAPTRKFVIDVAVATMFAANVWSWADTGSPASAAAAAFILAIIIRTGR